jgi:hypothetical protein
MVQQWYAVENLVASTISDTRIDLAWDIIQAGMTGITIEYSTDGVNYSYLDFIGGSEVIYSATSLTANTHYWFRLQGVKSGTESEYCSPDDDWTSVTLQVVARGDGSGVAVLTIKVSATLELKLSGSARFYTDSAGTLGESTTTTVTATGGLVSKYIKCPSGTCNLQFMDANYLIGFGHALDIGSTNPGWGRSIGGSYDANTPKLVASNWIFPNCVDLGIAYAEIVTFAADISALSSALEGACLTTSVSLTGELADIGDNCVLFYIAGANTISGNLSDMPSGMEKFSVGGSNTITGDIVNIPASMIRIEIGGSNTITGDIVNLPQTGILSRINIGGSNTISGSIADLDYSGITLTSFSIGGYNTISGAPSDIPSSITTFFLSSNNSTFSGDISGFSATLDYVTLSGTSMSLTGSVSDLAEGILQISFACPNDITGNVSGLPSTLTYIAIGGSNTISGDVSGLPSGLTTLSIQGSNTITGNISGIPSAVISFNLQGSNTVSGSVAGFSSAMRTVYIYGSNTISGAISAIPSTLSSIAIAGANTISGSLSDISNVITQFVVEGNNTIDGYTSGKTWSTGFIYSFTCKPVSPGGLDATEIDNLFIDLDTSWITTRSQTIDMRGTNAAPTVASAAARASLASKGRAIYTN